MRYLLAFIVALLLSSSVHAQVTVSLNFNTDRQPVWGPTGYDRVEYYYLPDIETYYDVSHHMFYYYEGGRWIGRSSLPPRYRDYNLYTSYKVVLNERQPYLHHAMYKEKYSSFRGRHDQQAIRDSREERYFSNKNHPEHNNWQKQHKGNNGHGGEKGGGDKHERNHGQGNHGQGNHGN